MKKTLMVSVILVSAGTLAWHLQAEQKKLRDFANAKPGPERAKAVLHSIEPKPLEIRKAIMHVEEPKEKADEK